MKTENCPLRKKKSQGVIQMLLFGDAFPIPPPALKENCSLSVLKSFRA